MKTLSLHLINIASEISSSVSYMIAAVKEVMSADFHVEQPQRIRVAVRVDHNPLPYRDSY